MFCTYCVIIIKIIIKLICLVWFAQGRPVFVGHLFKLCSPETGGPGGIGGPGGPGGPGVPGGPG